MPTVLMKANLPPPERRGLVLIDPPYEVKNERELALDVLRFGIRRFRHGHLHDLVSGQGR